jgi:2'-5' RNA ligase
VIRLFAALALPESARARLAGLQKGLDGRLVAPESFHLTLAFFGEVAEPLAEEIDAALAAIEAPGFTLWLDGVAAFGGAKPRALYASVRPEPALEHLHAKTVRAARMAGAEVEARRFTPHVTLARLKPGEMGAASAAAALAARAAFLEGPIPVRDFRLYESVLGRKGPTYLELARYPLAEARG